MTNNREQLIPFILQHLDGLLTENELKNTTAWKSYSEADELLSLIKESWDAVENPVDFNFDGNSAWKKIKKSTFPKVKRDLMIWERMAAVFLIGLFVWWLYPSETKMVQIVNTSPKTLCDTLPDNSIVWLKSDASIAYAANEFNVDKREIALYGETYFQIETDKARPFIVQTQNSYVLVTGTAFNVKSDSLAVEVFVEEGKVQFTNQLETYNEQTFKVDLLPGELANYNLEKGAFSKTRESNANLLCWKTQKFRIKNQTLSELINSLEAQFNICLETKDINPDKFLIKGNIKFTSIQELVNEINKGFLKKLDNDAVLSISNCN